MATAERPPAQPVYILRGHSSQIHALHFYKNNLRLLTGDTDGWVVIWDMAIRRPIAVWRAHEKSILTLQHWGDEKVIT
jgi:WD40 repeat protein